MNKIILVSFVLLSSFSLQAEMPDMSERKGERDLALHAYATSISGAVANAGKLFFAMGATVLLIASIVSNENHVEAIFGFYAIALGFLALEKGACHILNKGIAQYLQDNREIEGARSAKLMQNEQR